MGVRFKDLKELATYGIAIDPHDPSKAVPMVQTGDRRLDTAEDTRADETPVPCGERAETERTRRPQGDGSRTEQSFTRETAPAALDGLRSKDNESLPPQNTESFARETSSGAVGDLSTWDDQTLLTGIQKECAEFRALDANYPARYHRLGTFIIETCKRLGDEYVRQVLRQEGIDNTRAWRMKRIAEVYTYEQAAQFTSVREIVRTLPPEQPRKKKVKAGLKGGGSNQGAVPHEPLQVPPPAAADETILDSFIRLGIEIRRLLGEDALDQAVEQIKSHVAETFEEAFEEV
jgi:hypothetical protein